MNDLLEDIQRDAQTSCFQNFIKLFEAKLAENRQRLDDAVGEEIYRLQGANRVLKELLKIKDPILRIKHHDGAFD